jgi:hypothetical protein
MTLNVTVVNHWFVAQVSDRRFTLGDKVFDDQGNKAVLFVCRDSMVAITYTGLAYIGELRTDDWLVEFLVQNKAVNRDIGLCAGSLMHVATESTSKIPLADRRAFNTYTLAGWKDSRHQQIPYVWEITNRSDADRLMRRYGLKYLRGPRIPNPNELALILISGTVEALEGDPCPGLLPVVKDATDPKPVVQQMVKIIRDASEHPDFGRYIGRDCMSIVLPRPGFGDPTTEYLPEAGTHIGYTPQIVTPGMTLRNSEIFGGSGIEFVYGNRRISIAPPAANAPLWAGRQAFGFRRQQTPPRPR